MHVAGEYDERPAINLAVLQRMKKTRQARPPTVYFLVLKHNALFFYEGEEQVPAARAAADP